MFAQPVRRSNSATSFSQRAEPAVICAASDSSSRSISSRGCSERSAFVTNIRSITIERRCGRNSARISPPAGPSRRPREAPVAVAARVELLGDVAERAHVARVVDVDEEPLIGSRPADQQPAPVRRPGRADQAAAGREQDLAAAAALGHDQPVARARCGPGARSATPSGASARSSGPRWASPRARCRAAGGRSGAAAHVRRCRRRRCAGARPRRRR